MSALDAKEALIATALDELAAAAPSLGARVVARKAGVNHGLVPYYFKDATGLLLASIEEATKQYIGAFEKLAEHGAQNADTGPDQMVDAIVMWALDVIRNDPGHFARRRTICAMARDNATIAQHARKLVSAEVAMTSSFVATVRGHETPSQDDRTTAQLLVALFDGLAAQAAIDVDIDAQAVATTVRRMIVARKEQSIS